MLFACLTSAWWILRYEASCIKKNLLNHIGLNPGKSVGCLGCLETNCYVAGKELTKRLMIWITILGPKLSAYNMFADFTS